MTLSSALRDAAAAACGGPLAAACSLGRGEGGAEVVRLHRHDGQQVYVKRHRSSDKHRRERNAYRRFAAVPDVRIPRLLASWDEPPQGPALLLEALPGTPVDRTAHGDLHRQAGTVMARLHGAACDANDSVPLPRAYRLRFARALAAATPQLDSATVHAAKAALEAALPDLADGVRVWCHRDYAPRNWLAVNGRITGVIDFEHARPDLPDADLLRLAGDHWLQHAGVARAFLDGYRQGGGPADPTGKPVRFRGLAVHEALATIAWAARQGDRDRLRGGLRALRAWLGDAAPIR